MPLAQFNIARGRWPKGDPRMREFEENVPRMNALAKRSPGFLWLLDHRATILDDPQMTWTLSLWESPEALAAFAFNTVHRRFFRRKAEWFEAIDHAWFILWPIEPGRLPTLEEALAKKAKLDAEGPSDEVFGWERFPHLAAARERAA